MILILFSFGVPSSVLFPFLLIVEIISFRDKLLIAVFLSIQSFFKLDIYFVVNIGLGLFFGRL